MTTEGGSVKRIFAAMPSASSAMASHISQPQAQPQSISGSITLPNSAVTVTPTNAQPPLQIPMSVAANLLASVTKANVEVTPAGQGHIVRHHPVTSNVTSSASVTVSLTPAPVTMTSIPEVDREEVICSQPPNPQHPSVIVTPAPIMNNGNGLKSEHKVSNKVEVTPFVEDHIMNEAKRPKLE